MVFSGRSVAIEGVSVGHWATRVEIGVLADAVYGIDTLPGGNRAPFNPNVVRGIISCLDLVI